MIPPALHTDLKLLLRALSSDSFPVIFLEHQNYRHIPELAQILAEKLPDVSFERIKLATQAYEDVLKTLENSSNRILWLEDAEFFLKNPKFQTYLNQKRDFLAQRHRGLLLSIRSDFMPHLANNLPDLYSVRALSLDWRTYPQLPSEDIRDLYRNYGYLFPHIPKHGNAEETRSQYQKLAEELNALSEDDFHLKMSLSRQALALLADIGDYSEGLSLAFRLVSQLDPQVLSSPNYPYRHEIYTYLILFQILLGEAHLAERALDKVLSEETTEKPRFYPVSFWASQAMVQREKREFAKSQMLLAEMLYPPNTEQFPELTRSERACLLNWLGAVSLRLGDWQKSMQSSQEALNILTENGTNLLRSAIYNNLGNVFSYLGEYEQAIANYQTASQAIYQAHPEGHAYLLDHYLNLGFAWGEYGKIDQARDCYTQAKLLANKLYGQMSAKSFQVRNAVLRRHMVHQYPPAGEEDRMKDVSLINGVIIMAEAFLEPEHPQLQEAIGIFEWYEAQLGRNPQESLADLASISEKIRQQGLPPAE